MNTFENEWTKEIDRLQAEKAELLKALASLIVYADAARARIGVHNEDTKDLLFAASMPYLTEAISKARAAIAKAERKEP